MKQPLRDKIKSVFLLIVFSMSMLAGFACSIGIDLGYNRDHHINSSQKKHCCSDQKERENSEDDCCANFVTAFNKMDKSVANPPLLEAPVFSPALISTFALPVTIDPGYRNNIRIEPLRRSCFLNNTDIRTSIRSFQI